MVVIASPEALAVQLEIPDGPVGELECDGKSSLIVYFVVKYRYFLYISSDVSGEVEVVDGEIEKVVLYRSICPATE